MRNRLTKLIFPLVAVLLLAPWPVAYAYDSGQAGKKAVQIRVAEPAALPSGTIFGRARGSITPGDLFYLDATSEASDIELTLHLTNTSEVARSLSHLIFRVGIYVERSGSVWQRASGSDGAAIPDTFITLEDGDASFALAGYARYKVTLDDGNFYCFSAKAGNVFPQFYLTVD